MPRSGIPGGDLVESDIESLPFSHKVNYFRLSKRYSNCCSANFLGPLLETLSTSTDQAWERPYWECGFSGFRVLRFRGVLLGCRAEPCYLCIAVKNKTGPRTPKSRVALGEPEKAEIALKGADPLYGEIRVENTLTNSDGEAVGLKKGAQVDVTIEGEPEDTVKKSE